MFQVILPSFYQDLFLRKNLSMVQLQSLSLHFYSKRAPSIVFFKDFPSIIGQYFSQLLLLNRLTWNIVFIITSCKYNWNFIANKKWFYHKFITWKEEWCHPKMNRLYISTFTGISKRQWFWQAVGTIKSICFWDGRDQGLRSGTCQEERYSDYKSLTALWVDLGCLKANNGRFSNISLCWLALEITSSC